MMADLIATLIYRECSLATPTMDSIMTMIIYPIMIISHPLVCEEDLGVKFVERITFDTDLTSKDSMSMVSTWFS